MWKMYRERRLFTKYKPSWEIVSSGSIEIYDIGEFRYQIKLPIDIRFRSRDRRYETNLQMNVANVILYHEKDDRDGGEYELGGGLPGVAIPPSGEHTASFVFIKEMRAKPLLDVGSCYQYTVYPGKVYFKYISDARSLNRSDKRTAQVIQGTEEGDA